MSVRLFLNKVVFGWMVLVGGAVVYADAPGDLAAMAPEETMVYVGWSGADAGSGILEQASFGQLMNEPGVHQLRRQLSGQLRAYFKRTLIEEGMEELVEPLLSMVDLAWQRPGAMMLLDAAMTERGPDLQLALVLKAGEQSNALIQQLEKLLQVAQEQGAVGVPIELTLENGQTCKQLWLVPMMPPILYGEANGFVVVALGPQAFSKITDSIRGGRHLTDAERFKAARARMATDPSKLLLSIYVDTQSAYDRVLSSMRTMAAGPQAQIDWVTQLMSATALDQVQSLTYTNEIAHGGFLNTLFFQTTGTKEGIFKVWDVPSLTDDDLRVVPLDAGMALVGNVDLASIYEEVRSGFRKFDPTQSEPAVDPIEPALSFAPGEVGGPESMFQQWEQSASSFLGFRVKEDLLDSLGDTMAIFDAPSNGGFVISGITAVLEVKDADTINTIIRELAMRAEQMGGGKFEIELKEYQHGDRDVHFLNVKGLPIPFAPAWSVWNNRMIIAAYPQMVINVIERLESGTGNSILANEDFNRGRQALPRNASKLCYINTRQGVREAYGLALPISQALLAMAQGEGIAVDVSMIPSLSVIDKHMFGDVSGTFPVEDGILQRSYGPLPITIPHSGVVQAVVAANFVAVFLPSLGRARELSKQAVSRANLHNIAVMCIIYAEENQGRSPASFEQLTPYANFGADHWSDAEVLHDPLDRSGRVSYVLVPDIDLDNSPPQTVLAYLRPDVSEEGVSVAFCDGSVKWMNHEAFWKALKRTADTLGDSYKGPRPWQE